MLLPIEWEKTHNEHKHKMCAEPLCPAFHTEDSVYCAAHSKPEQVTYDRNDLQTSQQQRLWIHQG
jgi:hypothetical protein